MSQAKKTCLKCGHVVYEKTASEKIVEGGVKGAVAAGASVLFPPAGIALGAAFVVDSINTYVNSNKCSECGEEYC